MEMLRDARKHAWDFPRSMPTLPKPTKSVKGDPVTPPVGLAPMLLEVLALCGYGLWMLLGLALALGLYSPGRGDALVPLALGCAFVSAGLLSVCLRPRTLSEWHGWRIGRGQRPTREAMLALATYLPMLGLAGLVRGSEEFWATRMISLVLALCSLVCLITSAYGYRTRRLADQAGVAAQLPISRLLSACYGGGLWLWVCLIFQADLPITRDDPCRGRSACCCWRCCWGWSMAWPGIPCAGPAWASSSCRRPIICKRGGSWPRHSSAPFLVSACCWCPSYRPAGGWRPLRRRPTSSARAWSYGFMTSP